MRMVGVFALPVVGCYDIKECALLINEGKFIHTAHISNAIHGCNKDTTGHNISHEVNSSPVTWLE